MILTENVQILRRYSPKILDKMKDIKIEHIHEDTARNGMDNIAWKAEGQLLSIHSNYDPEKEAAQFIEQFKHVDPDTHVLFYGIGLGYHIDAFLAQHPQVKYSLFEPIPEIFHQFVSKRSLGEFPLSRLNGVSVPLTQEESNHALMAISHQIQDKVLLVVLPAYERIFAKESQQFYQQFQEAIKQARTSMHTNWQFEKRWTVNSLINFKETFSSPNIFHDVERDKFVGRPAILIAAGPSLADEIENLRKIKQEGTAYLFAVGSAINALIEHDLLPHAVCTYDPTHLNLSVFEKIIEKKLDYIPLIYGSSVGFEVLQNYRGPKLHMLTSQDTVAPFLLKRTDTDKMQGVLDAPSIAVVTYQLLSNLGCNPIVLVGQNLGLRDNQFYSEGIKYKHRSEKINTDGYFEVESVDGGKILTNESMKRMRLQLEGYIAKTPDVRVVNTTKQGAKIVGTEYVELDQLMNETINQTFIQDDWYNVNHIGYNESYFQEKSKQMTDSIQELIGLMSTLYKILREIHLNSQKSQELLLETHYKKLDKTFKKLKKNDFFKVFLLPMNRVKYDLFNKKVSANRFQKDTVKKSSAIVEAFGKLLESCEMDMKKILPVWYKVCQQIEHEMKEEMTS